MMRKGQVAVEFYAFIGFFLMTFTVLGLIFLSTASSEIDHQKSLMAWQIGHRVSDSANFALLAGAGFKGNFSIPKDLIGHEYYIGFTSGSVIVFPADLDDYQYSYSINTGEFIDGSGSVGSINYTTLNTSKGYLMIENINQSLKIYQ